jgi:hypothetical protein
LFFQLAISMHDAFRKRLANSVHDIYTAKAPADEHSMYKGYVTCSFEPRTLVLSYEIKDLQ